MHLLFANLTPSSIDLALLILRVTVGAVFLAHGINHIIGGGKIAGTARWFDSLGMRPGIVHAWTASLTEVAAGALLVLGLLTPFGGAGVVGVMLVAWITNHRGNGFFIFRPGEGWEYVMTLTFAGVAIATLGPGNWSIDGHVSALQDLWGWPGFWIGVGAGGLGAAGLLATFWRPAPKQSSSASG
jgi:putative oxidoreductase